MGIKIKNLQTGEFEKFNIPALKGEKGEPGEIEPSEKVDYIGKQHSKLRDTMNANVDYIIKTAISEFNYLDYEGQHITTTNSIEGHAKSAILKGNTLKKATNNLFDGEVEDGDYDISTGEKRNYTNRKRCANKIKINPSTTYTLSGVTWYLQYDENGDYLGYAGANDNRLVFTSKDNAHYLTFYNINNESGFFVGLGDTEPLYELVSVKMPVLTTTGKNLFDKEAFYDDWKRKNDYNIYKENVDGEEVLKIHNLYGAWPDKNGFKIFVKKDVPLTLTFKCKKAGTTETNMVFMICHADGKYINASICRSETWAEQKTTFTPERNYITICTGYNVNDYFYIKDVQIEEGTTATSYEPHKSNILTCNEEVELRGIDDIKDTLDCLTGKMTERIGEIVLDGSDDESWGRNGTLSNNYETSFFTLSVDNVKRSIGHITKICDKLPVLADYSHTEDIEGVTQVIDNQISIRVLKTSLSGDSVEGLKAYLQSNPITVQYQFITESIKTVDLSDNHVYSYKGTTHYSCSSEEGSLVPTLSVKVPTDTQLTIQEQKATTQTLLIKNMDLQQSIKEVQAMNLAFNTALYNSFNSIREEVEDIKKHVSTNENLEGSF